MGNDANRIDLLLDIARNQLAFPVHRRQYGLEPFVLSNDTKAYVSDRKRALRLCRRL
jgi:hypothetical protein